MLLGIIAGVSFVAVNYGLEEARRETEKVYIGVVNRKKYINESFDMLLNPNLF